MEIDWYSKMQRVIKKLIQFQNIQVYQMGCCGIEWKSKNQNNIIQLIILNKNKRVKKKVNQQGIEITKLKINFIGDTILHYACKRNNRQLVMFFKKIGADFTVKNDNNQTPIDMVEDSEILQMITGSKWRGEQKLLHKQQCSSTYSLKDCIQQEVIQIKVSVFDRNNRKKIFGEFKQKQKRGIKLSNKPIEVMQKQKIFSTASQINIQQKQNKLRNPSGN